MTRILVTGGSGQLGKCFNYIKKDHPKILFHFLDIDQLDITDYESILIYIKKLNIKFIINCAAYTQVDLAEDEPEKAKMINVLAIENLVKISKLFRIKIIHISTDYVFNGLAKEEIKEDHEPNPLGVYGKTKLEGENIILNSKSKSIIVRTSWLYSPYEKNFFKTILNLSKSNKKISVINDQWGKPTSGLDLAKAILKLINSPKSFDNKIYHYSNKGVTTWHNFAKEILELINSKSILVPIKSIDYPFKAIRPKNVALNTNLIETTLNLKIPYWKDSLKKCLKIVE